ncbi:hypothetical protein CC80DRAFT_446178 [Byssothecium circinans]|uniref:Uncharacterized protein n=1 Tax=Byssothecium circinans TaxID=147558 RepID=A0A6A5TTQ4_9PLEO|nr:hypothetical protein CC80DRAFT_446178 [Byssothecium circinans]
MAANKAYTTIDESAIGLDRANIDLHGLIELPNEAPQASNDRRSIDSEEEKKRHSSLHRVRASISEKKHDATLKIKKTLHIGKSTETSIDEDLDRDGSALANPVTEASSSRLHEKLPVPEKATVKDFMHHPIDTTKDKVSNHGNEEIAANIAAREISHGQDVDLLNAHEEIQTAETDEKRERAEENFEELLKERQNMFVRWTMDRHVTKVRVLPKAAFVRKGKEEFTGKDGSVDWRGYGEHLVKYVAHQYGGQYVGYGMDHPRPSKKTIMPNIERLIVASAPFQEFIMTTRRVYRWESPRETLKYLSIYAVLWYFGLLFPGMISALTVLVIQRKFHQPTMHDLRQDIERTENQQETALTLTEFIEKEGEEEWADKIMQEVGPWLMIQLADLANFFEVTRNFYEWRVPTRTAATLSILILVILTTAFAPAELLIRCSTLGMGIVFFGFFPFAVNFPEYRLLASIPKRVFWNIPTHAEWSIKAIQAEGTRYKKMHPPTPRLSSTEHHAVANAVDYGHYTAHHDSHQGRLTISSSSIRFTAHHDVVLFSLPYADIERVEKIDRMVEQAFPLSKVKSDSGKDLKIIEKGKGEKKGEGKEWVVEDVDLRDQVFSQILGFSDTAWQVVW